MLRDRMRLSQLALRIALARPLDLDHLGAVVAHHRGRDRAGDEARQIQHAQSLKRQTRPLSFSSRTRTGQA